MSGLDADYIVRTHARQVRVVIEVVTCPQGSIVRRGEFRVYDEAHDMGIELPLLRFSLFGFHTTV